MQEKLPNEWQKALTAEFDKPYFRQLCQFVSSSYENTTELCFPEQQQLFSAFEACSPAQVKVVILGQDPYHGQGQAHGLAFSVQDNQPIPASLRNIFKEISTDLAIAIPENGNLNRWAKQGVLLLNDTLTVSQGKAGSHQKMGWEKFTDAVIEYLSENNENLVFLLWGNHAHKKGNKINAEKHLVLKSGHPSPLSANQGKWFGNRHFSQANQYLKSHNIEPVKW